MPIANHEQYCQMLDNAKKGGFAYPAINISSIETANAVLQAFAESKTDGILQVSTGAAQFASGASLNDMVLGAKVLAESIHLLAEAYPVLIALHTDHCHQNKLNQFLDPLLDISESRVAQGRAPLFNSHMFDGSNLPLEENLTISKSYLERCAKLNMILEVETGVVGGEEDGVDNSATDKSRLYTTPEEMVETYKQLNDIGRFMLAATFGNVHGVYKPGNVQLEPGILRDGQNAVREVMGTETNPLDLVFHGGSGSSPEEIAETLSYGVIKMNVDTDTQYAFTRSVADHMFANYHEVLKIDGEVGNKKKYDPRSWLKKATSSMKDRVMAAVRDLKGENTTLYQG